MGFLKIDAQSIRTELKSYKDKPYKCLFEFIWNSFDAGALNVKLAFNISENVFGMVSNIKIIDDGDGWDFKNKDTEHFLSSSKSGINEKSKSLPMGQYGRGRYAFIWIADYIEISSRNQKIILDHSTKLNKPTIIDEIDGTIVEFKTPTTAFSDSLSSIDELKKELITEFGWFLAQNENYSISINDSNINISEYIKDNISLTKSDFPHEIIELLDDNFKVRIILWNSKLREYSKFYYLSSDNKEIYKENTGFNKKNDNFWHSIYINSPPFGVDTKDENETSQEDTQTSIAYFDSKQNKYLKRKIKDYIKTVLTNLRKPYLAKQSEYLLRELKEEELLPDLTDFGIYDEESYGDLIKTIYTISPSLFTNKNESEKRFICATFAGLLSTQDDILIKKIIEQLNDLTEEEQKDLLDILNRTSLANVVRTIKEVDHRLDVLEKLKILISEHEKETLEVKHIQKILDENFWLFGEQFRLFSSTEGSLKNVLIKYAEEILEIENPELTTKPSGEVDLFLTKREESEGNGIQKNIIVEIKRASKKLRGNKEYQQINNYRKKILEQDLCNGENQYWEFYLIGKDYDTDISELIDNAKNHGEKNRGLALLLCDGRVKVYVRKWSDILEVEWGVKMKYLKEKLEIQSKKQKTTSDEIAVDI